MRLHYLVEGPSEAALLETWLPRALPDHVHEVYPHEGKGSLPDDLDAAPDPLRRDLLHQLPAKLRAYGRTLDPKTDRVIVLVDADNEDCVALKDRLVAVLDRCTPRPEALIRIAVEETEAFYLGDVKAMRKAFGAPRKGPLQGYVQDSVCGTWEVFQAVIGSPYVAKVHWARRMGEALSTARKGSSLNRSPSFLAFYRAACSLAGEPWR